MPDKCWCGKKLVQVGDFMAEDEGQRVMHWECEDHGASRRWRPCPKYGGDVLFYPTSHMRICSVFGPQHTWPHAGAQVTTISRCASCPIPAKDELIKKLLEAVTAWARCRGVVTGEDHGKCDCYKGTMLVAFAAVEKAEKEAEE